MRSAALLRRPLLLELKDGAPALPPVLIQLERISFTTNKIDARLMAGLDIGCQGKVDVFSPGLKRGRNALETGRDICLGVLLGFLRFFFSPFLLFAKNAEEVPEGEVRGDIGRRV